MDRDEMEKMMQEQAAGMCFFWVVAIFLSVIVGCFCWPYAINHWLEWAGKVPSVQWWQGGLIGLVPFVGPLSIPAAVITWIVGLFM